MVDGTDAEVKPLLGPQPVPGGVEFRVWAPDRREVEVLIFDPSHSAGDDWPSLSSTPYRLAREVGGYHAGYVEGVAGGALYMYRLDGELVRPDPASRYQPYGVHGPSCVPAPDFEWTDDGWRGIPMHDMVIYEAHTGTITREGTFEAMAGKLPYLTTLGVSALEVMPVADFPGVRNWGYDGVCLYAPARAYGGPVGLKRLVNAAHAEGLAVILDVVYNHLGPDGNYLRDFAAAYFTHEEKTPWGDALNFADPHVRHFFVHNALYWAREYHLDGLRLDATHSIIDHSDEHILSEITRRVREELPPDRYFVLIAEDERNEATLITAREEGGTGLDAVWADDFHHQARSAMAGDNEGYYADYSGSAEDLADTINRGWFYRGQRSEHLNRDRGTDPGELDPAHFVYCIQNHDQIGNRPLGERLNENVSMALYRAASALLLLSPYTPLLFQGQEWAASTPFLFFTDHNTELGKLITEGRRAEFASFSGFSGQEVPDPQAEETFTSCKLAWDEIRRNGHSAVLELYRELLALRRAHLGPHVRRRGCFRAAPLGEHALALRYSSCDHDLLLVVSWGAADTFALHEHEVAALHAGKEWRVVLYSEEPRFGGDVQIGNLLTGSANSRLSLNGAAAVVLRTN